MKLKTKLPYPLLVLIVFFYSQAKGQTIVPFEEEKVYLQLDKPLYESGDDIWFKAYLRNGNSLKPSAKSDILYVELINPSGKTEKKLKLIARNGKTNGDFILDSEAPGGIYKIRAYTNWMKNYGEANYFEREITVQKVLLPRLLMSLEFEKKAYGAGDHVLAFLKLETKENKPLANHEFNYVVSLSGSQVEKKPMKTSSDGKATLAFALPATLNSDDGILNVMIDYDGYTESISRGIPIVMKSISIDFFAEGGNLIDEVKGTVAFKAMNEKGKSADVEGEITDEKGNFITTFKSYHNGMGKFDLEPKEGRKYFAKILKPEGITALFQLPSAEKTGFSMNVLMQNQNEISLMVYKPTIETASVIVRVRDEVVYKAAITSKKGWGEIKIPVVDFPVGIAQVTVFDEKGIPQCERLVFVNKHKQLKIEIITGKKKYQPREEVELRVKVTDENNKPVAASLSLAVVDDKVISFADDKQDNILSSLLLSTELRGKIEEPAFYFKKNEAKADSALDLILMTHGWRRFSWKQIDDETAKRTITGFTNIPEKIHIKGIAALNGPEKRLEKTLVTLNNTEDSVYTDKMGRFEFDNPDPEKRSLLKFYSREGYKRYMYINNCTGEFTIEKETKGTVFDSENGRAIAGAYVFFKGTTIGTYTDSAGNFILAKIPENNPELVVLHNKYELFITEKIATESELKINLLSVKNCNVTDSKKNIKYKNPEYKNLTDLDNSVPYDGDYMLEKMACEKKYKALRDVLDRVRLRRYDDREKVSYVDEYPKFPGGEQVLEEIIYKNLVYPANALNDGEQGKITVGFWIKANGKIDSNSISIQNGDYWNLEKEAMRLVKLLPAWIPAKKGNENVDYPQSVTINFSLDNDNTGQPFKIYLSELKPDSEAVAFYRGRDFYWPVYNNKEEFYGRTDFRKTIYWNPILETGKDGKAICRFYNSDEITQFRITAEGMSNDGKIAHAETTYFTQLPFSIDARIPAFLSFGDTPKIPVTISNNTDKKISVDLYINLPDAITSLSDLNQGIYLGPNSKRTIDIDLNVENKATKAYISVNASCNYLQDRVTQYVEIFPNGFPVSKSFSGSAMTNNFELNIEDPVKNSIKAEFTAYPSVLSELMGGVESILQEPHGCFEQTSSTTYPNILALQLMKQSGNVDAEINKKAQDLVEKGYKMLVGYETKENGYEWFGHAPMHPALTAYGLMEFKDMKEVYTSVDNKMVQRTVNSLLKKTDKEGGFKSDDRHQFGSTGNKDVWNAYILYGLAASEISGAENLQITNGINKIYKNALDGKDVYMQAVTVQALIKAKKYTEAESLLSKIKWAIKKNGFGNLAATQSITGSGGISLQVETASFILLSLLEEKTKDEKLIMETIEFIVKCRQGQGGFGSTQATVMALKSLAAYAKTSVNKKPSGGIAVYSNNSDLGKANYSANSITAIHLNGFDDEIIAGKQNVSVDFKETKDPIPFEFNVKWFTNTPPSSAECKVEISAVLEKTEISQGETVRLIVGLKNKTVEEIPTTMVSVGIPAGLSVQPWQLKELSEKNAFDYYEIKDNCIYFYYTGMLASEQKTIALDLKAEIKGEYLGPASSAYLYYTNEYKNWAKGLRVNIK